MSVHDVAIYDPGTGTGMGLWYPATTGIIGSKGGPGLRSGHSMLRCTDPQTGHDFAVVFGGIRNGRNFLSDTHVLTAQGRSYRWLPVRTFGKAPSPRCYHSAAVVGTKMVVFGGNNADHSFGDVYVLDMTTGVAGAAADEKWAWFQPSIAGSGPCRRTGAAATPIGDRFVVITGGWDPDNSDDGKKGSPRTADDGGDSGGATSGRKRSRGKDDASGSASPASASGGSGSGPFSDVFILDCKTWEWIRVMPSESTGTGTGAASSKTNARVGHSAVFVPDAHGLLAASADAEPLPVPGVLIYGGVTENSEKCSTLSLLRLPACLVAAASLSAGSSSA